MEILECIRSWAETDPDRVAYLSGQSALTYGELEEQSDRLAHWISRTLDNDQSPIIVYGHMEPGMIVSFLACAKSGHAYIPIDLSVPDKRFLAIREDSHASLVISPGTLPDDAAEWPLQILDGESFENAVHSSERLPVSNPVAEDDNFYIIYTSGTTGRPKGVQITSSCLESFVTWAVQQFELDFEHAAYLNQAPYSFDLSVMDLYPCLVTGGKIWAADHELIANPRRLFQQLKDSRLTVWTSTPSFAEMCLSDPKFNADLLPHLRRFLFCGEVLPPKTAKELQERFPEAKVFNSYGPSETTVAVTSLEVTGKYLQEEEALPVGYCKPDSEIRIIDSDGVPLPEGEKGEIAIIGPSVSIGYLGKPELTEQSFFTEDGNRGYRTGDTGLLLNGLLYYKGRMDFQIKLNGYRIELEEIENGLREVKYVQNAVVIPEFKAGRCRSIIAYVIAHRHSFEKDYQLTSAIRKELTESLPAYTIPRKFKYVQTIPMTSNGKVDRQALMEEVHA